AGRLHPRRRLRLRRELVRARHQDPQGHEGLALGHAGDDGLRRPVRDRREVRIPGARRDRSRRRRRVPDERDERADHRRARLAACRRGGRRPGGAAAAAAHHAPAGEALHAGDPRGRPERAADDPPELLADARRVHPRALMAVAVDTAVERLSASAYTIPTDERESDGTLEWDRTTIVVVEVRPGGATGPGYTYTDAAAARLVGGKHGDPVHGAHPTAARP